MHNKNGVTTWRSIAIAAGLGLTFGLAPQAALAAEAPAGQPAAGPEQAAGAAAAPSTEGAQQHAPEQEPAGSAQQGGPSGQGSVGGGEGAGAGGGDQREPAGPSDPVEGDGGPEDGAAVSGEQDAPGAPADGGEPADAGQGVEAAADPALPAEEPAADGPRGAASAPAPQQQAAGAASGVSSAVQPAPQAQGAPSGVVEGTWVVEEAADGSGLQRYFILEGGEKAQGLFKAVLAGVEGWFYAYGNDWRVARGRVTVEEGGVARTYLADNDGRLLDPGWHVTDAFGQGLQRYYVDADAHACVEGYSAGGWGHYTRPEGYVVRGKYDTGAGTVVLANNDGLTASGTGWLVTGDYDGALQRYWLVGDGQAHSSYFEVDGRWYFGLGGEGYVLRGVGRGVDGSWLTADNDGKLAEGWVVTDAFGQGLQRYWFVDGRMAEEGVYDAGGGWWTYVTDRGYVLRGKLDSGRGRVYLADNDGRLASLGADGEGSGWLVTGKYDGGSLQRYWIDGASHAAVSGFFTQDLTGSGQGFFGVAGQGYVLRGTARWGDQVLLANNDGVMASAPGWLVTDAYGQGLQRYWIEGVVGQAGYYAAKIGFGTSTDGVDFYGTNYGYVLRNGRIWRIVGDSWDVSAQADYCEANNDGKLIVLDNAYTCAVSAYITWALGIAADDTHGYDQQYRWGERGDYDCSALAVSALRQAGLNTGGASYTGNMRSELMKHGFVWITDLSQLQRGDILLSEGNHTAIYLGDGMLVHASGNEYGKAVGGKPGDQTGREVCWRDYYDYPWDGFLRLATA